MMIMIGELKSFLNKAINRQRVNGFKLTFPIFFPILVDFQYQLSLYLQSSCLATSSSLRTRRCLRNFTLKNTKVMMIMTALNKKLRLMPRQKKFSKSRLRKDWSSSLLFAPTSLHTLSRNFVAASLVTASVIILDIAKISSASRNSNWLRIAFGKSKISKK